MCARGRWKLRDVILEGAYSVMTVAPTYRIDAWGFSQLSASLDGWLRKRAPELEFAPYKERSKELLDTSERLYLGALGALKADGVERSPQVEMWLLQGRRELTRREHELTARSDRPTDALEALRSLDHRPETVIVDVDNTLVPYGHDRDPGGWQTAMGEAVAVAESLGCVRQLVFMTNGRQQLPVVASEKLQVRVISRARKPFVESSPLRSLREELAGATVIGDQWLTDALLARRLQGRWIEVQGLHTVRVDGKASCGEPGWPRLMRFAGSVIRSG